MNTASTNENSPISATEWILLALTGAISALLCRLSTDYLPQAVTEWAKPGLLAVGWVVFFTQRERRPLVAEAAAALGTLAWWVGILNALNMVEGVSPLLALSVVTACIFPLPFLLRQRLIIGLLLLLVPIATIALLPWVSIILTVSMSCWMLGEKWLAGRGRFRVYGWVAVPAFIMTCVILAGLVYAGRTEAIQTLPVILVISTMQLQLHREPSMPQWLLLSTCLLPLLTLANTPYALICGAVAYAALLLIAAMRRGQRHRLIMAWCLLAGIAGLTAALMPSAWGVSSLCILIPLLTAGAYVCRRLAYRMPQSAPEIPCAPFPTSRVRTRTTIGIVALQFCALVGLLTAIWCDICTAPTITMPAVWSAREPGVTMFRGDRDRGPLDLSLDFPLPEGSRPILGSSLSPEPGSMKNAPETVAAFLRKGEDGLWHISRAEVEHSPQDAAREGELRISASLIRISITPSPSPEDTRPTHYIRLRPHFIHRAADRAWNSPELSGLKHTPLRLTAEVVMRRLGKPIIKRFLIEGLSPADYTAQHPVSPFPPQQ